MSDYWRETMARKRFQPPLRVAAVLVWIPPQGGVPLIATHVPRKADPLVDYSETTPTGPAESPFEFDEAMSAVINDQLSVRSGIVTRLGYTSIQKGKRYQWYLVICRCESRFEPDPSEIYQLIWHCPQTLPQAVEFMSDGRCEMFLSALAEAVELKPQLLAAYERPAALLKQGQIRIAA